MIIDFRIRPPYKSFCGSSLYNKKPLSQDETKLGIFDIGKELIPSYAERSIELFMQAMEDSGTTKGILMGRKADNYGDIDNDEIYELTQMHPDKFVPFMGVNPLLDGQIEEIEKYAKLNFRGIGIDAGWLRTPLYQDDSLLDPIYAKADELGLIVSITSSFMLGPDMSYSDPDAIQRIAFKYPNLKIVIPHACWPHVNKALALAIRCPNIYLMPDCYMYIPGFPLSEEYVNAANTYLKYRILYASSYPVRSLSQSIAGWKARNFTKEALENTLYKNAERLLG